MKNICQKIISITLIIILLLSVNISIAVTQSEINEQRNKQTEINNQIDEAEGKIDEIEAKKSDTLKQVESLNKQIDDYESEIDKLDSQIDEANAKIKEAEQKIAENEAQYNEKEETFKKRLIAVYEAGETTYLDFLLSSKNLIDFLSNYYLISEVAEMDTELMNGLQKQKEEIEESKKQVEASKQELTSAKASKEVINNQLKSSKAEKDKYVSQLTAEEKELQKLVDELKNHESSIKNEIKRMQEEYDRQHSSSGGGSVNNGSSSYGFGWPVTNHTIGTGFGVSGKYWSSGYHTGIDFPVPDNTPIYAVGDGQVFDTGYNSAYGNFVEIYHGNNIYSYYAHGTSRLVSKGQIVSKGQLIMYSGHTGNVTGPHLHFEIRTPNYRYADCVNPRPYLP